MNDLEKIEMLIVQISDLQKNANQKYWPKGIFPNFRSNKWLGYSRPDNSIFYTASIVHILQSLKTYLPENLTKKIEQIEQLAKPNYAHYQSITGDVVHNFYPTRPSKHFGNGYIFKKFKHFQLPHDADDTALVYLVSDFSNQQNEWLQKKLALHANGSLKKIKNTFEKYKTFEAYSTWFGKNMAIEFDAVVLCNILNSQLSAQLTLDKHGLASWEYIKNCILNDDYLTDPFQISHNYAKSSIIVYHVGKLIAKYNLPEADKIKEKLKVDLFEMLAENSGPTIDNLLISSTLHRLNLDHEFEIEWPIDKRKTEKYSFFIAGLLSSYENTFLQSIAILPIFHIQWNCPAHTLALITENLLLKNHKKT